MEKVRIQTTDRRLDALLDAARAGMKKSFLSKPGGTRYGAAVLTADDEMFSAGQYSSFNHITNIHAEMAAIVMATMAGKPDIVALAVVSSSAIEQPERPCGICRQFMLEHCQRIGHDILVCMGNRDATSRESATVCEMLPSSWTAAPNRA